MAKRGGRGGVENALANKIFRLQKQSGGNVPGEVVAAARRQKEGTASQADHDAMRSYLGIHRSGASAIGKGQKFLNKVGGKISNIQTQIQLAQGAEGSQAVVAQSRLVSTAINELNSLTKSKGVNKIVDKVASFVTKDPAAGGRFLKALGRGLRLGGVVGTILFAGIAAGTALFEARGKLAQSVGAIKDLARQFATDPRITAAVEKQVYGIASSGKLLDPKIAGRVVGRIPGMGALGALVTDYLEADIAEEAKNLQQQTLDARGKARGALLDLGAHPGILLAEFASRRGKTVGELTPQERNEAVDQFIADQYDFSKFGDSNYVEGEMAKRVPLQKAYDAIFGLEQSRRDKFSLEYSNRLLKSAAQRANERKRVAEATRLARDPAENFRMRVEQEEADARWTSHRSRHRAWQND